MSALNISDYKKIIRERMGDYRFSHSVNVAKEAKKLAKHYGADENKAEIAGILHDITKEMPKEQQLQIIIDSGIILDNVQLHAPKLWHGMSGSIVVRDELGIDDEDILNAIRYHTTGRAGMSLLEKVIFTADFTSSKEKNFQFRRAAIIHMVANLTVPSARLLSCGARTLAGTIAVS